MSMTIDGLEWDAQTDAVKFDPEKSGAYLLDLMDRIRKIDGIERIRLSSLEPRIMTESFVKGIAAMPEVCPHFHLSLQSGCNATLRRMNRHYTKEQYIALAQKIRGQIPDVAITTDIMVGFPSETEEEFNESFEFVKKVAFAKAHIFSYSRREGTIAAAIKNQVLKSEKTVRSRRMQKLCEETELDFLNSQLEKVESVLFETLENGFYVGYTPNYTKIYLESDTDISGKILSVKLTDIKNDGCLGVLN